MDQIEQQNEAVANDAEEPIPSEPPVNSEAEEADGQIGGWFTEMEVTHNQDDIDMWISQQLDEGDKDCEFLGQPVSDQLDKIWTLLSQLIPLVTSVSEIQHNVDDVFARMDKIERRLVKKYDPNKEYREMLDDWSLGSNIQMKGLEPDYYTSILNPLNNIAYDTEIPDKFRSQEINKLDAFTKKWSNNAILKPINQDQVTKQFDRSVSWAADLGGGKRDGVAVRNLPKDEDIPEPVHIIKSREFNSKVIINVGGERHQVLWKTLEQMPHTRLGKLARAKNHDDIVELVDFYSIVDNEFFFDRHPRSFKTILNYFRTGKLHIIDEMCVLALSYDLQYWNIPDILLESCCRNKYLTRKEFVEEEIKKEAFNTRKMKAEVSRRDRCGRYQEFLWDIMERPDTSLGAKVVSLVSVIFVVVSTVAMVINTLPDLAGPPDEKGNPTDNKILSILESICITWFTLEYILRLAGAPKKCEFLKDGMNIVDILAILPYFVSALVIEFNTDSENDESFDSVKRAVSVFRIMRVMRIFKLGRHSTGLQSIAYTMKNSYKELFLLALFMCMGMLVFASLCYFAEKDDPETKFVSIPTTFWWAIITMTTVGYGDMYPKSSIGRFIGLFCAISGVLVMALPIPIVVNNFAEFYLETKKREKQIKRKEEKEKQLKEEQIQLQKLAIRELEFSKIH